MDYIGDECDNSAAAAGSGGRRRLERPKINWKGRYIVSAVAAHFIKLYRRNLSGFRDFRCALCLCFPKRGMCGRGASAKINTCVVRVGLCACVCVDSDGLLLRRAAR